MIKLDATVQKHIIGMDTVLSEELFNEFKRARSIAEKRYITFKKMMAHAMDASNRECLTKTNANTLKINDYLKHIGSLKNELEEAQSNAVEMEPSQIPDLNASTQGLPDTLKDKKEPSPVPHAAKIQNVNEGKQYITKGNEQTRTLVWNVSARDDRKQNLDPGINYGHTKKKMKIKYKFAMSDSESPSVMESQEETLDFINEKENEEENLKGE
ncbi:hypothetical protein ACFX2I_037237 [Malus domestica]